MLKYREISKQAKAVTDQIDKQLTEKAGGVFHVDSRKDLPVLQTMIEEIARRDRKKVKTSIRLDEDIHAWLTAGGPGWQSSVNKILRTVMEASK